jgi:hypothetical protein
MHLLAWSGDEDVDALEGKVMGKRYSPWDMYRLLALKGNPRVLSNWANKILADLHDVDFRGEIDETLSKETIEAVKEAVRYALPKPKAGKKGG